MTKSIGGLLVVCCLFVSSPALAHKVIASVFASGQTIEGEIGLSNGDMAADTLVEVFDDAGNKLGETKTGDDGFFVFTPTEHVVHLFRANLGAGHVAEVRMEIADLPEIASPEIATPASQPQAAGAVNDTAPAQPVSGSVAGGMITDQQTEWLMAAVRQEIKPLRREIAAYKEKNDLQTILGGIGYICGLFGVGFYFAGRHKFKTAA